MNAVSCTGERNSPRPTDAVNSSRCPTRSGPGTALRYSKEQLPLGGLPEPLHVAGVEAQDEVVLDRARGVEGGDHGVGRGGQGAGALHHGPEGGVDVEALVDAEAGPAEAGEAVSRRLRSRGPPAGVLRSSPPRGTGRARDNSRVHGEIHRSFHRIVARLNSDFIRKSLNLFTGYRSQHALRAGQPWLREGSARACPYLTRGREPPLKEDPATMPSNRAARRTFGSSFRPPTPPSPRPQAVSR